MAYSGDIAFRDLPTPRRPPGQSLEIDPAQKTRMKFVQPAVISHHFVPVFRALAIIAKGSSPAGEYFITAQNRPSIAERAQVLGGVETRRRHLTAGSRRDSMMGRPD